MANVLTAAPPVETIADLLERLGDVPADRVRFRPFPGTATEADVLKAALGPKKRLCELVDGVLVEKTMGAKESVLAALLIHYLVGFAIQHKLGVVLAPDGALRLMPGLVRIPDVSFLASARLIDGKLPNKPIPDLAPDLAVEVLSKSNTKKEMERKLRDYFSAGVRLVWFVDPPTRTVRVYTSVDQSALLRESDDLDGGDVLPGFRLPLLLLFAEAA